MLQRAEAVGLERAYKSYYRMLSILGHSSALSMSAYGEDTSDPHKWEFMSLSVSFHSALEVFQTANEVLQLGLDLTRAQTDGQYF